MRWWNAILALTTTATASGAQTYLPLIPGSTWDFAGIHGESESQRVVSPIQLWDRTVSVISYFESDSNTGLENYWTADAGGVDLWGFYRRQDGVGFLYRPPIRMADAPLYLGKSWTTNVEVYTLPDTNHVGTFDFGFEVYEEGIVEVPAGHFYAYATGGSSGLVNPILPSVLVTGEISGSPAIDWWCEGVGDVQYIRSDTFQLVSIDSPVPSRPTSWGTIKSLYVP